MLSKAFIVFCEVEKKIATCLWRPLSVRHLKLKQAVKEQTSQVCDSVVSLDPHYHTACTPGYQEKWFFSVQVMEHLVIKYQKDQFHDFFNIDNIPHFERKLCCSAWRGEDLDDAQRAETRALSMPGLTCHRWYHSGGHGQLHIFDSNFKMWAAVFALGKDFSKRDRRVISGLQALRPQWIWLVKWKARRAGWNMAEVMRDHCPSSCALTPEVIYSQTNIYSDTFSISYIISVICYSLKKL